MNSGMTWRLYGVWGTGPNNVYAVGEYGKIRHYDGSSWSWVSSGTTDVLRAVWGSGPNDVFAVGDHGTILHYDGMAWSEMRSGTPQQLCGVWGSGPEDVFAVGSFGLIIHYPRKYALSVGLVNGLFGDVSMDPAPADANAPAFPVGTAVALTAVPVEGKGFKHWKIYDPNHPADANYAAVEPNDSITVVMDGDREVTAVFKCGSGMEQALPLLMIGAAVCAFAVRRTRPTH